MRPQTAEVLDDAQRRNFATWDIPNTWVWPNAVVSGSYEGEVDHLSRWLGERAAWRDAAFNGEGVGAAQ